MQFYDVAVLDGVRKTRDGYMVASAKTARTGIQIYSAGELGLTDRSASDPIRVYRSADEVFHKDALASMAHRPVTVDHPSVMVDAKNWKSLAGGMTGDEVARDGEFVRIPLTLMDQGAIDAWEQGKRELSWGYTCDVDFTAGVTPEGQAFDAQQRGIRANHLAVCTNARGGAELRLGDRSPPIPKGGPTVDLKTIIVDGLPVQTTDAGEAAVNKLKGMLDAASKAMETATAAHATALAAKDAGHVVVVAAKDAELGKKDAEIVALTAKVVDIAALDIMVADRAAVVAKAKVIAPTLDTAGKTNADIRRAAVASKLTDAAVKDKSDDYVGALFDHIGGTADQAGDPLRDAIRTAQPNLDAAAMADAEWKRAGADLNAWRNPKAA